MHGSSAADQLLIMTTRYRKNIPMKISESPVISLRSNVANFSNFSDTVSEKRILSYTIIFMLQRV